MRPFSTTDFYKQTGAGPLDPGLPGLRPLPDGWDGTVLLPAWSIPDLDDPARLLAEAIVSCRGQLADMSLDVAIDCALDAEHYCLIPERNRVARFDGGPGELVPVHFDLGGTNVGRSTDEMREALIGSDGPTRLLEPAAALLLLTQFLWHLRLASLTPGRLPVMLVECAGARYSPNGNGRFDDVPRWDVYPPVGDRRGLAFLNWNWSRRSRPAQGVAIATDARA